MLRKEKIEINQSNLGLQNLPSEIDQNMHELRQMDDDLQSKQSHNDRKKVKD